MTILNREERSDIATGKAALTGVGMVAAEAEKKRIAAHEQLIANRPKAKAQRVRLQEHRS